MRIPVRLVVISALLGLMLPWAVGVPSAAAHADLIAQSPRDGQFLQVSATRTTVRIDFGELVEVTASGLRIRDYRGTVLSGRALVRSLPTSDPDVTPSRVWVTSMKPLARGRYAVEYSVLSQDGHRVIRAFGFSVGLTTSASRPAVVAMRTMLPAQPAPAVTISRPVVGWRSITVAMPSGTSGGEVRLTCQRAGATAPRVSAPFVWTLGRTIGGRATASGYLPTPCSYRIGVTVNRAFPRYPSSWQSTSVVAVGG
ncbi:unannotated protein [freshwater metagenome]|uniref:Unannotated protein n=1 Tax=freshwater metagenome TaxID=449393 RepID=A0A6J7KBW6_9ZZZZ